MNDQKLPSREGGARLRVRDGRGAFRRFMRAVVFLLGLVLTVSRGAAALIAEPLSVSPLMRRASAGVGFVLELAADPAQTLGAIAVVATVSVAIAAWRRSVAAGTFVAGTLIALIDRAGPWVGIA